MIKGINTVTKSEPEDKAAKAKSSPPKQEQAAVYEPGKAQSKPTAPPQAGPVPPAQRRTIDYPPPLDVQMGPLPDQGPHLILTDAEAQGEQVHQLPPGQDLTLSLRNRVSLPSWWIFEGCRKPPKATEVQRDVPTDGKVGGVSRTVHYTYSHQDLKALGKQFTLTASLVSDRGPRQILKFRIVRG